MGTSSSRRTWRRRVSGSSGASCATSLTRPSLQSSEYRPAQPELHNHQAGQSQQALGTLEKGLCSGVLLSCGRPRPDSLQEDCSDHSGSSGAGGGAHLTRLLALWLPAAAGLLGGPKTGAPLMPLMNPLPAGAWPSVTVLRLQLYTSPLGRKLQGHAPCHSSRLCRKAAERPPRSRSWAFPMPRFSSGEIGPQRRR